ncbi:glutamine synthetase [Actinomycetes bacterium M1A6_2h]
MHDFIDTTQSPISIAHALAGRGIVGLTIAWFDNNGIVRSRIVTTEEFASVALKGVGVAAIFPVFDTHDTITNGFEELSRPSGDFRVLPVLETLAPLAGQPGLAWAAARQLDRNGEPWPWDARAVLARQVDAAAERGLTFRAGYEIEFSVFAADGGPSPAESGAAYSGRALIEVDDFVRALLKDLAANGVAIGQLHAEFGKSQFELSLAAVDPMSAADNQLLARQTIYASARTHGLRVSFSPVTRENNPGNGWHLHTSVWREENNLLSGDGPHEMSPEGASYVAGILRDLPAVVAVTAPSEASLLRRRPGFWAGAYGFWGVENREAALRYVLGGALLGAGNANVELKPSDASSNPYLALAVVIGSGLAGIADALTLPQPIRDDVGGWSESERADKGVVALATDASAQAAALAENDRVRAILGPQVYGAFAAVRASDAVWADGKTATEIIDAHLWRY